MGEIYNQFLIELKQLEEKYRNEPAEELNQLLLLALEREELVATSYQEKVLNSSIDALNIPSAFKSIFKHSLIWIWKDEEMHTDFVRSGLLKTENSYSKLKIFLSQFQGYIGGWSGSVLQLSTFRNSPISVTIARVFMWFGSLGGKVPKEIAEKLSSGSLKDFCAFNLDAEKTAWACWVRIVVLAKEDIRFSANHVRDFQKIVTDEHNHGKIFGLIHDSLTDSGDLQSGADLNQLVQAIQQVSEYFLPREYRPSLKQNPLGRDKQVYSFKDFENVGRRASFLKFLSETNLEDEITNRAKVLHKTKQEVHVVIKVALSMGYAKHDTSPIIEKETITTMINWLNNLGIAHITLLDVQSIYAKFYHGRELVNIAKHFDYPTHIDIVDGSSDLVAHEYTRGIGVYHLSNKWKNADFRLNLGKLRSHPTEMAMLSIANLEWLVGNLEDFVFVDKLIDRTAPTMIMLDEFPPHFSILDAYQNIPDGLVGVMGSKSTIAPKRWYGSTDALSLDTLVMRHLNNKDLAPDSLLQSVDYWFGGFNSNITVLGEDSEITEWRGPTRNFFWSMLNFISYPVYKFMSQRGSLFLPPMDTMVFPEKHKSPLLIRLARSINNRIIGLK